MRRVALVSLFLTVAASGWACLGEDPSAAPSPDAGTCIVGSEGCACTSGGACNAGLECRSNVCVATDAGNGGTDSGGVDSGAADSGGGCLSVVKAGQDQPSGIVDIGDGLAWVNLGASPSVVFADYTGVVRKTIAAPGANGAIAFDVSAVVWADGTSVRRALTNGALEATIATTSFTIGAVATTNGMTGPNAYFTEKDNRANGVHYCPLVENACDIDSGVSTVPATVGSNVTGIIGHNGLLYWTNSMQTGSVKSCVENGGCPSTTDYGTEPHPPIFLALSNTTPFWTTFVQGMLRSQNNTIATGTPAGIYYALATDGESVFFQALDSAGNGGIYAVKATASSAAGKFIAPVKFPGTFGIANGVAYGNKHFYWTDQATNSIYGWDATCAF